MAHIVQEDGQAGSAVFVLGDDHAFFPQTVQRLLHEVERSKGVVEAVVDRSRIHEVAEAELADAPEALDPWVVHDLGEIGVAELDEPIDRVIQQLGSC